MRQSAITGWVSGPLVAAVADMAILALLFNYFSPQSEHLDYPFLGLAALLGPGFLLFVICGLALDGSRWIDSSRRFFLLFRH
jgi:hypothetical protein